MSEDGSGRSRPPRPPAPRPEPPAPAPRREPPPPPPKPDRPARSASPGLAAAAPPLPELTAAPAESVLDLVDSLLNKGAVVTGDVVLGLAGIDLVYLKLSALLAAADRVTGKRAGPEGRGGEQIGEGGEEQAVRASVAPAGEVPRSKAPGSTVASGEPATDGPGDAHQAEEPVSPSAEPSSVPVDDRPSVTPARPGVAEAEREIDELRAEIERGLPADRPPRWNADPEEVERSVAKLVLTLVELVRQLLERQALRRMEEGTLTEGEVETLGRALMRLEETVHAIAGRFDIPPEELNLDLGPLGRLL